MKGLAVPSRVKRSLVVGFLLVLGAVVLLPPGGAPAATARLPDLGMAPVSKMVIDTTAVPGRRLLRYSATLVNVGAGPLEVVGSRPDTSTDMTTIKQRIYDDTGGFQEVSLPGASMYWRGDGHNHWHLRDVVTGDLRRLDNGVGVGTLAKHDFCTLDNTPYKLTLPGAPQSRGYPGCGTDPSALAVTMGISVGWGDTYGLHVKFQWIDITGLKNGKYRLVAAATDLFQEADRSNNSAWAKIRITGDRVQVLASGPGA
jgi:hypothetical protein